MKKVLEFILIVLITISVIELLSIILAVFITSLFSTTSAQALIDSKIYSIELLVGVALAYVYTRKGLK